MTYLRPQNSDKARNPYPLGRGTCREEDEERRGGGGGRRGQRGQRGYVPRFHVDVDVDVDGNLRDGLFVSCLFGGAGLVAWLRQIDTEHRGVGG